MPLAAFGFLLPEYVREDQGFQTGFTVPNPAPGTGFSRKTPGEFYEVVASFFCNLVTVAAGVPRTVILLAQNGDGVTVDSSPAASATPQSVTAAFRWSLAVSAAYVPIANVNVQPVFALVFPPGWRLVLTGDNIQAGDQFTNVGFVLQQYSTGEVIKTKRTLAEAGPLQFSAEFVSQPSLTAPVSAPAPSAPAPSAPAPSTPAPSAPAPSAPATAPTYYPPPAQSPAVYIPLPSPPEPVYIPTPRPSEPAYVPTAPFRAE